MEMGAICGILIRVRDSTPPKGPTGVGTRDPTPVVILRHGLGSVLAYLATPKGDLTLPLKVLAPLSTAFLGVLGAWASWTYLLWKRDSKRERIKEAHGLGRRLCPCSESGEIMTLHNGVMDGIEAYSCPNCVRYDVRRPNGEVFIADDTEFAPPLPKKVHAEWVRLSRNQR